MSDKRVLEFKMGDLIPSPTTQYQVQNHLGHGSYGIVVQCRNVSTNEMVALKIVKSTTDIPGPEEEEAILQNLKELHSEMYNIVRLKDSFTYKEDYCLVFEHLGIDLQQFMKTIPTQHLELKEIRPILQQLAISLEFLKSARIVHTDLKPQNIMMVDPVRQPLKVKVIDFGLACNNPTEQIGCVLQSLWYRSPEILQKAPFNEAIDVWSLGCIAAELSMGRPLFPAPDETNLMKQIEFTTGKQADERNLNPYWFWPKQWMETRFLTMPRLTWGDDDHAEICDQENFINLLTEMLVINQFERITPKKILQHPFITMSHFEGPFKNSSYVKLSKDLMSICRDQTSDDLGHGDQINLRRSHTEASSSSTLNLAEEGRPAGMGHEEQSFLQTSTVSRAKKRTITSHHKPDDSQAKIRRSERLAATRKTQVESGRKRKRDDPTSDGNPSTKKRNTSLKKELWTLSEATTSQNLPPPTQASLLPSRRGRKRRCLETLAQGRDGGQPGERRQQLMGHEEQSFLQTSTVSRAKKRRINSHHRPDDSQPKIRRSERLAATRKTQVESGRKRKNLPPPTQASFLPSRRERGRKRRCWKTLTQGSDGGERRQLLKLFF